LDVILVASLDARIRNQEAQFAVLSAQVRVLEQKLTPGWFAWFVQLIQLAWGLLSAGAMVLIMLVLVFAKNFGLYEISM
jgi:hypothetical protein